MIRLAWILLAVWAFGAAGVILFFPTGVDIFLLKVMAVNLLPHAAAALFLWLVPVSRRDAAVMAAGVSLGMIFSAYAFITAFFLGPDAQGAFVFMLLPFTGGIPVLLAGTAVLLLRRFGKDAGPAEK